MLYKELGIYSAATGLIITGDLIFKANSYFPNENIFKN